MIRAEEVDERLEGNYGFALETGVPTRTLQRKVTDVAELWDTLGQLVAVLWKLIIELAQPLLSWSLLLAWLAWWLWGVNWKKTWSVLAEGAWVGVLLLMLAAALAWSQMAPSDCSCLGFMTVPNFWWQLGSISLLVAVTVMCGWLQGVFGWTPTELDLEPPAPASHGHGHSH